VKKVSGGTFHSFANLKLRQYAAQWGFRPTSPSSTDRTEFTARLKISG